MTVRYLTIDGGTTNTRVTLIENGIALASKRLNRGAKAGIDDREGLKTELKQAIKELLAQFSISESDVIRVLASGMITSEFGLLELPHVNAPAGIRELHESMADAVFPEITPIPFSFVRGVKINTENLDDFDMMRGEETEICGLIDACGIREGEECVCVLPGSHSKIVDLDRNGRITSFSSTLTGEMIASLSRNTILKDAVDLSLEGHDREHLLEGYRYAKAVGLNKTLFKVRILKNRFQKSPLEVYSFFLGAVLADEIDTILKKDTPHIVLGGKRQIKEAIAEILGAVSDKRMTVISEEDVASSTARGVIRIFEYSASISD